jgi:ubiquinone/menaquinone biosynthesis C-methylase UbiE
MNADPIARVYRWLEYAAFGKALEHARFDFLSYAVNARQVLILGEGDGRFLARLIESNCQAAITVVESSGQMIELARGRLAPGDRSRVEFHQRDAITCSLPRGPFDLVVSHFFLDVFPEAGAKSLIGEVAGLMAPRALWLISEFQQPESALRSLHARLWLRTMYTFFGLTTGLRTKTLPPYRDHLSRAGFTEIAHRERRFGLIRSQLWSKSVE